MEFLDITFRYEPDTDTYLMVGQNDDPLFNYPLWCFNPHWGHSEMDLGYYYEKTKPVKNLNIPEIQQMIKYYEDPDIKLKIRKRFSWK